MNLGVDSLRHLEKIVFRLRLELSDGLEFDENQIRVISAGSDHFGSRSTCGLRKSICEVH